MRAAVPRIATSVSRAKTEPAPALELIADNGPAPTDKREGGKPLPWALCLVIWAAMAAGGWAAIVFLLHKI